MKVLDVALEAALRTRRVVALRTGVLEVCVHVRVEVVLGVAWRKKQNHTILDCFSTLGIYNCADNSKFIFYLVLGSCLKKAI